VKGWFGGAFGMWLGLVALQTLVQPAASGRVSSLFVDVNNAVNRLLAAWEPGIPDRRPGAAKVVDPTAPVNPGGGTGPSPTWGAAVPTRNPFAQPTK